MLSSGVVLATPPLPLPVVATSSRYSGVSTTRAESGAPARNRHRVGDGGPAGAAAAASDDYWVAEVGSQAHARRSAALIPAQAAANSNADVERLARDRRVQGRPDRVALSGGI